MTESAKATPAAPPDPNAKAQADAAAAAAEAEGKAKADVAKVAGSGGPVPLGVNPPTDVLGVKLPDDPDKAKAQAREAAHVRQARIDADVKRVERGIAPQHNDNAKPEPASKGA